MHAAHPEDVGVIRRLTRAAYDVSNLKATRTDEKMELTYYARDVQGLEQCNVIFIGSPNRDQ
ncbi:hypothetical protein PF008_g25930 [Phytophthora fragariae]|uniref:Uncharacterized protein n=1 Tax=Phytophthora fragariae TaxID=53985 RepID=A0A6G0QJ56_9STRA|nr:hypothetical protein PF008_g25930 [Phytophthora fragariae]